MAPLAALSLGLLTLCPQGEEAGKDPRLTSVLKPADINGLKKKTAEWINAQIRFRNDDSPRRARKVRKTRQSHHKAWASKSKKADLLKHMGDMLAVFDGVFTYPKKSTSGEYKSFSEKPKGLDADLNYGLVGPRGYRGKKPFRTVVLLVGQGAGDQWADPKPYFESTWKKAPISAETFFFIPKLRDSDDYDKLPDLTKPLEEAAEMARIGSVLSPLGEVNRQYNLSRTQMILDCGKGMCGWGIRLASYFPMRFAGLVLRHPVDVGDLQLDSLGGRPILLVSSPESKEACEALKKRLDKFEAGACTILEGKGAYPFLESQGDIDKWVAQVKRPLFPNKVVIAANHDRFRKSHWINIIQMEPLDTVAADKRPLLVAEANKEKNTVTVTSRSVTSFFLYLNDALVDLDSEVTLIVNGRQTKHKFRRRLETMVEELIIAFDATHLYTVRLRVTVPKPDDTAKKAADKGEADKDKGGGKGDGK